MASWLFVLAAYLIGSVSFAVVVSKLFALPDPHSYGSGNPGATNVLRTGNRRAAVLTLLGDVLKGVAAVLLAKALAPDLGLSTLTVMGVGLAAFLGHLYPVYHRFAGGQGVATGKHAASIVAGTPGILHGARSYLLQDEEGQVLDTESISAGLDYPGVGPEHCYLSDIGRAQYVAAEDADVLETFGLLTRIEGILPALESTHALAYVAGLKGTLAPETVVMVNLAGRGDKDVGIVEAHRPLE